MATLTMPRTMREAFVVQMHRALDDDPRVALVLADISADRFTIAGARHPGRVINVGIREQAMIGVAGGLALSGLRPVVHTVSADVIFLDFGNSEFQGDSTANPLWQALPAVKAGQVARIDDRFFGTSYGAYSFVLEQVMTALSGADPAIVS